MRIAVLGDFHLNGNDLEQTRLAIQDIKLCSPNLVIPLGDFGTGGHIGSPEGLRESYTLLQFIEAPMRPIMGNHDLQRESGEGKQQKGTMEKEFIRLFGLEKPYGVIEYEHVRLLFASTEPQPADSCYQVQECYATDEQFHTLVRELDRRRGVPVIFFTHAPPLGSGLKTVPHTHVRSTNAYLDQNHEPERWMELYRNYPEIVMWFSAHYHLSHIHPNSHTVRNGTHFFMTGVHSQYTRDGRRQSRIIDISADDVFVHTLDHDKRGLISEGSWQSNLSLVHLMQAKKFQRIAACPVGQGPISLNCLTPMQDGRYVTATEDGYSWEVRPEQEAVMGSLHVKVHVHRLVTGTDGIWSLWDDRIGRSSMNDLDRFVRDGKGGAPIINTVIPDPIRCLAARREGGVWFVTDTQLCIAHVDHNNGHPQIHIYPCSSLTDRPHAIEANHLSQCWIVTTSGQLNVWKNDQVEMFPIEGYSLAIDCYNDQQVVLSYLESKLYTTWIHGSTSTVQKLAIPVEICPEQHDVQIIILDHGKALIRLKDKIYICEHPDAPLESLHAGEGKIVAISRACGKDSQAPLSHQFALAKISGESDDSWIEVWQETRWKAGSF